MELVETRQNEVEEVLHVPTVFLAREHRLVRVRCAEEHECGIEACLIRSRADHGLTDIVPAGIGENFSKPLQGEATDDLLRKRRRKAVSGGCDHVPTHPCQPGSELEISRLNLCLTAW